MEDAKVLIEKLKGWVGEATPIKVSQTDNYE